MVGQRRNTPNRLSIIECLHLVVEEDCRHTDGNVECTLFFDHTVKAADGIGLESAHGAALINDEHELNALRRLSTGGLICSICARHSNEQCA